MSFQVDDSGPVLVVTYSGTVDDTLALECLEVMLTTEGFATKDQLVDYTDVDTYQVTIAGLKELSVRINSYRAIHGKRPARNAYVLPEDIEYGMGRVFLAYVEADESSHLFRSLAEARAWLGLQDHDLPSAC